MSLFWAFIARKYTILDRTRVKHYNLRTRCQSRINDATHSQASWSTHHNATLQYNNGNHHIVTLRTQVHDLCAHTNEQPLMYVRRRYLLHSVSFLAN